MNDKIITASILEQFQTHLIENEKSPATVKKYLRDVLCFENYGAGQRITKQTIMAYKAFLAGRYAIVSANSMLASLNAFLRFMGWGDLCIKQFRVQRQAYLPEEKELNKAEYQRLANAARQKGSERLYLIIQTICSTGIRVSELPYITVEALHRGEATVRCKGKTRSVFIVRELRSLLMRYVHSCAITSGPVFITKSGKPVNRTAIWRDMKALCHQAGVSPCKVYPHNLRHLFARTFYGIEKDIAKLADLLGHTSINITRIYIATTGAEHRKRMEHMHLVVHQTKKRPTPKGIGLMMT